MLRPWFLLLLFAFFRIFGLLHLAFFLIFVRVFVLRRGAFLPTFSFRIFVLRIFVLFLRTGPFQHNVRTIRGEPSFILGLRRRRITPRTITGEPFSINFRLLLLLLGLLLACLFRLCLADEVIQACMYDTVHNASNH